MAGLFSPSVTAFKCRYTAVAGLILDSYTGQDGLKFLWQDIRSYQTYLLIDLILKLMIRNSDSQTIKINSGLVTFLYMKTVSSPPSGWWQHVLQSFRLEFGTVFWHLKKKEKCSYWPD